MLQTNYMHTNHSNLTTYYQRIVVSDLMSKLCRQHSVIERDGFTFRDLITKIGIVDTKNKTPAVYTDLSLLTILIR
jgi:hypothetical protein